MSEPTPVPAEKVGRIKPPFGSLASLLRNRDKVAAGSAGKLTPNDIIVVSGRGICRQWTLVAGLPRDHGTVTDEAAMLALHVDSAETAYPRWVVPGDTCMRTDLGPGYVCLCISGNGTAAADWAIISRKTVTDALAAAISSAGGTAAFAGLTGSPSDNAALASALASKAPLTSPALTGTPTAPTPTTGPGIATKQYVDDAVASGGGGSGGESIGSKLYLASNYH